MIAVVVTRDRLHLLQECVARLRSQTFATDILIVDNASTDGTGAWLAEQRDLAYILQRNLGGSGGFHTGIKGAYWLGYDFVWCMDDDTLPEPSCLEELMETVGRLRQRLGANRPVGWVCSKVVWLDGSPAVLNRPVLVPDPQRSEIAGNDEAVLAHSCSFVSACISREAIASVGLPYREMFIWQDDVEYTRRITEAGYIGALAARSVAVHKTATNEPWPAGFDRSSRWKSRYGFRNTATLLRTISRGSLARFTYLFTQRGWWITLSLLRNGKARWVPYAWYWLVAGLLFRPKRDPVEAGWSRSVLDFV